jgi:putative transposase
MKDIGSLSHTKWECKYPVVFIPKYRRKAMYQELRQYLGKIFHELARQKECRIEEGHLCADHVHILISIPPKYSMSQVMGFIKGKSAYAFGGAKLYAIARNYGGKRKNVVGQPFWARGYYVSTVGRDEGTVRKYIQEQEQEDQRIEQLRLSDEW